MKGNIIFLKGRNKAGNLVFYTKGGIQMARGIAETVNNPRTPAQVAQRARFGAIVAMSKGFGITLKKSLAPQDDARVSARNWFYKLNKNLTMTITSGVVSNISYSDVKISTGDVVNCAWATPDFETSYHIKVQIDAANDDPTFSPATDDCNIIAYCPALQQALIGSVKRVTGQKVDITTPRYWQGQQVYLYSFCSRGGDYPTVCSDSEYVGSGEVA